MAIKDVATSLFDKGFDTAIKRAIEVLEKSQSLTGQDLKMEINALKNLLLKKKF